MISADELAKRLRVSATRVRQLAAQGRITGAEKLGERTWMFPETARVIDAPRTRKLKEKARKKGQRWDVKRQRYIAKPKE